MITIHTLIFLTHKLQRCPVPELSYLLKPPCDHLAQPNSHKRPSQSSLTKTPTVPEVCNPPCCRKQNEPNLFNNRFVSGDSWLMDFNRGNPDNDLPKCQTMGPFYGFENSITIIMLFHQPKGLVLEKQEFEITVKE